MIRLIVFALLAYLAYHYTHNWYAVIGVGVAYVLYGLIAGAMGSSKARQSTDTLLHRKMSDAEKAHFGAASDHQRAMDEHKAQFDPDLRKKL
jgi:hypothetical protein